MDILQEELNEVKTQIKNYPNTILEACVKAMVRVKFQPTIYKQLVACFQFPDEYPNKSTLIEIRSKYLSQKLSDGLTKLCEEEIKKYIGKPQILRTLAFISKFLQENPLCWCSEEIFRVRKQLQEDDKLKIHQNTSSLSLIALDSGYKLKYSLIIPQNYPVSQVEIEEKECNYPPVLRRWFLANSKEIARKCVMAPTKQNPKEPPFVLKPSLEPVAEFLINEAHKYSNMDCPVCGKRCFSSTHSDVETDENKAKYVERVYCGHIYHFACLDSYIRTPPFQGGKVCLICKMRIYHDRWKLTPELAEKRWAHKQAKQRELDEVVDFLS
ncbi:UNVERIFIED_CONTAM: hypothetical protein RMT77_018066 [Armadillidium vulgare]|nr:hypothetical protein Avbf_13296 [Armadillidium vulgare]